MILDRSALEDAVAALGPNWRLLHDCYPAGAKARQNGAPLPAVLVNHEIGVALLDIAPQITPGAVERLRGALQAAQFHDMFPGSLPILHRVLTPEHLIRLPDMLDFAFSWEAPLTLAPGEAWADMVQHILTGEPARVPEHGAEVGVRWRAQQRMESLARARRRPANWVLAGFGLLLAVGGGTVLWPNVAADPREVQAAALMAALEPDATEAALTVGPIVADAGAEPVANSTGNLMLPEAVPSTGPVRMSAAAGPPLEPIPELSPTPAVDRAVLAAAFQRAETLLAQAGRREVEREFAPDRKPPPSPIGPPALAAVAEAVEPRDASWDTGSTATLLAAEPALRLLGAEPDRDTIGSSASPAPAEASNGGREPDVGTVPPSPVVMTPTLPAPTISALLRRGDAMLALKDVSAARLFYNRAAVAGSGQAATAIGKTYDPAILARLGVHGMASDPAAAASWYRTALALNDATAGRLLAQLEGQPP